MKNNFHWKANHKKTNSMTFADPVGDGNIEITLKKISAAENYRPDPELHNHFDVHTKRNNTNSETKPIHNLIHNLIHHKNDESTLTKENSHQYTSRKNRISPLNTDESFLKSPTLVSTKQRYVRSPQWRTFTDLFSYKSCIFFTFFFILSILSFSYPQTSLFPNVNIPFEAYDPSSIANFIGLNRFPGYLWIENFLISTFNGLSTNDIIASIDTNNVYTYDTNALKFLKFARLFQVIAIVIVIFTLLQSSIGKVFVPINEETTAFHTHQEPSISSDASHKEVVEDQDNQLPPRKGTLLILTSKIDLKQKQIGIESLRTSLTPLFEIIWNLFWKLVFATSIVYMFMLLIGCFLSIEDAQSSLRFLFHFIPILDRDLEKQYAEDCTPTWDNIFEKVNDVFFVCHFVGWFVKALLFRDTTLLWITSIMWELIEKSFTFLLPNFKECWWDSWVLDVLVCNSFGIFLGLKFLDYYQMMRYTWFPRGENIHFSNNLNQITSNEEFEGTDMNAHTSRNRDDILNHFQNNTQPKLNLRKSAPNSFRNTSLIMDEECSLTNRDNCLLNQSFRSTMNLGLFKVSWSNSIPITRLVASIVFIILVELNELNCFILKDILGVHFAYRIVLFRLFLWVLMCAPGIYEAYTYIEFASQSLGAYAWMCFALLFLETILSLRWGFMNIYRDITIPSTALIQWTVGGIILSIGLFIYTYRVKLHL